ncbi:uncharacterized protein N7459_000136 [Penicillium hispanicum]|uniref:uncharacterized protein n=1 Tax=Penicillium hispanicum TaxID=1080232 RepID=UPI0025413728|nr:uncharacterized protein N7459_000136 [Penicillium hispanicum]KAJ5593928.1 hypothetical protein N7459_000136 [Penicillium hispanicum]
MAEHDTSPSERTPLVERPNAENEPAITVSLARGMAIIGLMLLFIFIQATNMSMMTTAQSDIAADLDAFAEATWFTSAYIIAMSSATPLAGRLSAIFTARLYIVFSTTVVAIGLFITASASTLGVFLLGRAVAGFGSGGTMTTSIILVLEFATPKRRGLCIGMMNAGYTTGLALGAVIAGLLTPTLGWRFIFWIQAPLALVLGPLLFLAIPPPPEEASPLKDQSLRQSLARIDYAGAVTLTLAVVLLLSSLASAEILIWPIPISALFFVLFVFIESRWAQEPVIPVRLLRTRSILLTCLAGSGLMMARWAVLFFTPVYAIAVRGWSPAEAGLILIPTNAGFGSGGLLVGWLHIRKAGSYYASCLVIFLLFALATAALSVLSTPESPTALYLVATFSNGLFAGALMNYTLSHLLHLTSPRVHYIVSSLLAMARSIAASFGAAAGGGLFTRILKGSLEMGFSQHGLPPKPDLVRTLLGSPVTVSRLTGIERLVASQSYQHAIQTLFLLGSLAAVGTLVLQAGTGWTPEVENKRQEEWDVVEETN